MEPHCSACLQSYELGSSRFVCTNIALPCGCRDVLRSVHSVGVFPLFGKDSVCLLQHTRVSPFEEVVVVGY